MKYKKEFYEENGKQKVKITFKDDNYFTMEKDEKIKTLDFDVYDKEKIYDKIRNGQPVDLERKFIKGFSFTDIRIIEYSSGCIDVKEDFTLNWCFLESNEKGRFDFSYIKFCKNFSLYYVFFGIPEKIKNVDKEVDFNNTIFNGEYIEFNSTNFGNINVDFEKTHFTGKPKFDKTKFGEGKVNFIDAEFSKGASFNCNFGDGEVNFYNATFKDGPVSFMNATFGKGKKIFSYADFGNKEVNFQFTKFDFGSVFFGTTNFGEGILDFQGATFKTIEEDEITFSGSRFENNEIYFNNIEFGKGNIDFTNTRFNIKSISFRNSKMSKISFAESRIDGECDMRVRNAKIIDFSNTSLYGNIEFGSYEVIRRHPKIIKEFLGFIGFEEGVKELKFINTKLYGKIHIDYDAFKLKNAINTQDSTHGEKQDQYRLFKENFRTLGQYDDEDNAYVQYMKHKIRHQAGFDLKLSEDIRECLSMLYHDPFKYSTSKLLKYIFNNRIKIYRYYLNRILKLPIFAFRWLIFEQVGLYGTNPARVALSMVTVRLLFSLGYLPCAHLLEPTFTSAEPSNIVKAMYHSAITFLTIGYGDFYPTGVLRFWSSVEGFLGLFLMAYFTVSFVRKVLR